MFLLCPEPIDHEALRRELQRPEAGALAVFEGWVRNQNEGRQVLSLEYESAPDLCRAEAEKLLAEARSRYPILDATIAHRVGHLRIGDLAVWIGVTSRHRAAAFDACRFLIEDLKVRLPIWKKEHYAAGGAAWIGETEPWSREP